MEPDAPDGHQISVVRGALDEATSSELVAFWTAHGVLSASDAEARLAEVVCLLRAGAGEIVAVNSVYMDRVEMLGGRRFWLYRTFSAPEAPAAGAEAMLAACAGALEREWVAAHGEEPPNDVRPLPLTEDPIGICVFVAEPELLESNRAAIWPESQLVYAGYRDDGAQARVRFFPGAAV